MKRQLFILAALLAGVPALAAAPQPCQGQAPERTTWPNGTLLWGSARQVAEDETSTVLASLDVGQVRLGGEALKGVRVEKGALVAGSLASEGLVGARLQGMASDDQSVEVALCGAEPDAQDPAMVWYRIEVWNTRTASWENPCIATSQVPSPRALAVRGMWDGSGAHQDVPGKFTFACENGAIAKCIDWGYKPWAKKDGRSLGELHQACTRMARADYCGDGRSHTRQDEPIDMYDELGLLERTREATRGWDPRKASFEAAWAPEGAWCMVRTREGQAVETIRAECPGRFEVDAVDLDEGDRCTLRRKGTRTVRALLRNHSYGNRE